MEPNQYKYMFEVEDRHWWYVGNHRIFLDLLLRKKILRNGLKVLDAGCGTGKWLEILKNSNDIIETGTDYEPIALNLAKTRGNLNLQQGDINKPLFPESSFDLITCFDVICNDNISDPTAINNFNTWLKPEGHLLLTVPAYKFLLGTHDKMVHQTKRYRCKEIKTLIEENGFEVMKLSYCVHLLFPVALIKRFIDKLSTKNKSEHNEVKLPPMVTNQIFLFIMKIEGFLLRFINLPFGLSVIVLAKKIPGTNP